MDEMRMQLAMLRTTLARMDAPPPPPASPPPPMKVVGGDDLDMYSLGEGEEEEAPPPAVAAGEEEPCVYASLDLRLGERGFFEFHGTLRWPPDMRLAAQLCGQESVCSISRDKPYFDQLFTRIRLFMMARGRLNLPESVAMISKDELNRSIKLIHAIVAKRREVAPPREMDGIRQILRIRCWQ